jgi:TolA-binding protein
MTNCDATLETIERYVNLTLEDRERAAFEDHFFECDDCFRKVQALQDARAVLASGAAEPRVSPARPARRVPPTAWMAIAAMVVLSVLVLRLPRQPADPGEAPSAPAPATAAPSTQAPAPAPSTAPAENPLSALAAITPPPYVSLTTRSEPDAHTRAFDEAMTYYAKGNYRESARRLGELTANAPALAPALFYLGVSELMEGRADRARAAFERTVRTGTMPYADEAHFYLAKAALRLNDRATAARELQRAVEREAGPRGEAARILRELK